MRYTEGRLRELAQKWANEKGEGFGYFPGGIEIFVRRHGKGYSYSLVRLADPTTADAELLAGPWLGRDLYYWLAGGLYAMSNVY